MACTISIPPGLTFLYSNSITSANTLPTGRGTPSATQTSPCIPLPSAWPTSYPWISPSLAGSSSLHVSFFKCLGHLQALTAPAVAAFPTSPNRRVAFQREPLNALEEPGMVRHYRGAFFGLGIGILILAIYSWRINLSPWVAILFFGLYFLLAITITRARAELGTPHEIYFVNPRLILVTLFGSQTLGAQNLTDLSVMYWFNRGYRCHPMPNQLEAMRMGEMARIRQSAIITTLIIAFIWGALVACWANIHVTFTNGATAKCIGFKVWVGGESYNNLQQWLQTPAR